MCARRERDGGDDHQRHPWHEHPSPGTTGDGNTVGGDACTRPLGIGLMICSDPMGDRLWRLGHRLETLEVLPVVCQRNTQPLAGAAPA